MRTMSHTTYESPIGPLTLIAGPDGLRGLHFPGRGPAKSEEARNAEDPTLAAATEQLDAYFAGELRQFELPLDLVGTAFQRRVWSALRQIPYGSTTSYGVLARELADGRSSGLRDARAVGAAVGRTPVPIIVPCHRVIGADGSLTGYGGGLQRKQALLDLEAAVRGGAAAAPRWAGRQLSLLA